MQRQPSTPPPLVAVPAGSTVLSFLPRLRLRSNDTAQSYEITPRTP
jgi:hypothetical protein